MNNINCKIMTESLVSKKVAKLAKQAGFNEPCFHVLDVKTNEILTCIRSVTIDENEPIVEVNLSEFLFKSENLTDNNILCPSQSLLQKWLRKKHNLNVVPALLFDESPCAKFEYVPFVIANNYEYCKGDGTKSFKKAMNKSFEIALAHVLNISNKDKGCI